MKKPNCTIDPSKILSIFCLYKPSNLSSLESFVRDLERFSKVALVINDGNVPDFATNSQTLIVVDNNINYGTLNAYNYVINMHQNYEYFWLWNQDSDLSTDSLGKFIEASSNIFSQNEKVAATTLYDSKNFINPIRRKCVLAKESTTLIKKSVVDSHLSYWFDSNFFMDCGDWDFSYRLFKSGALICQIKNIPYSHKLGDDEHTIFGQIARPSITRLFMQGVNFYQYTFVYKRYDFISFLLLFRTLFVIPVKNLIFKDSFLRIKTYYSGIKYAKNGGSSVKWINNNFKL